MMKTTKQNFAIRLLKDGRTWFVSALVAVGVLTNVLGYAELPWKVKAVADKTEDNKSELDKFIIVQKEALESEKKLNEQREQATQKLMEQQSNFQQQQFQMLFQQRQQPTYNNQAYQAPEEYYEQVEPVPTPKYKRRIR